MCAKFHDHTYAVLYAHCSASSHCLRLVAIGYNYVILPHDNGKLDYMCVQSFMITHMQCFMLIVKYKVIYVVIA